MDTLFENNCADAQDYRGSLLRDADFLIRLYHLDTWLSAQEPYQGGGIGRGIHPADVKVIQLWVLDHQLARVVAIEVFNNVAQRRVVEDETALRPRRRNRDVRALGGPNNLIRHNELLAGSHKNSR